MSPWYPGAYTSVCAFLKSLPRGGFTSLPGSIRQEAAKTSPVPRSEACKAVQTQPHSPLEGWEPERQQQISVCSASPQISRVQISRGFRKQHRVHTLSIARWLSMTLQSACTKHANKFNMSGFVLVSLELISSAEQSVCFFYMH